VCGPGSRPQPDRRGQGAVCAWILEGGERCGCSILVHQSSVHVLLSFGQFIRKATQRMLGSLQRSLRKTWFPPHRRLGQQLVLPRPCRWFLGLLLGGGRGRSYTSMQWSEAGCLGHGPATHSWGGPSSNPFQWAPFRVCSGASCGRAWFCSCCMARFAGGQGGGRMPGELPTRRCQASTNTACTCATGCSRMAACGGWSYQLLQCHLATVCCCT
jgi:hypothetical protein